ncbi:triacylglycerol lipase [Schumannella sp. 10F1B-5-1]|uniref:esterase/lipase family protein n=1 Tax=Schumannella sp. 10F1B-5-1 TaxID=2590780 RepID=UPI001130EE85|nr:alpha/beta hydrolase [Schumannella sp. 10F1B-5-1]TPW70187.1 alpha/beta hydrolase [Schumannella sp. 10F1B-5-1]
MTAASPGRRVRFLLRDYPWALRARARGLHVPVPSRWAEGDRAPIVLIPGVYETWNYLEAVGDRLARAGHPVIALPSLRWNSGPIPETATEVWREIVERDLRDVILVAHSKGGIIGKHLLAIDDTEQRIDRMVTMASPFGGSRMARFMPQRALQEFRIGDPLLTALAAESRVNARITSIYPVVDPHVPEGSRLEGAVNVPLRMAGHFQLLFDERGIQAVVDAVDGAARPDV